MTMSDSQQYPEKLCWIKYELEINVYDFKKLIICGFSTKVQMAHFYLILLNLEKRQYLPHYWSNEGLKGTLVTRAVSTCHGGSLEITLTVPLIYFASTFLHEEIYRKIQDENISKCLTLDPNLRYGDTLTSLSNMINLYNS